MGLNSPVHDGGRDSGLSQTYVVSAAISNAAAVSFGNRWPMATGTPASTCATTPSKPGGSPERLGHVDQRGSPSSRQAPGRMLLGNLAPLEVSKESRGWLFSRGARTGQRVQYVSAGELAATVQAVW